jgi:hypothetical protein
VPAAFTIAGVLDGVSFFPQTPQQEIGYGRFIFDY